MFKIGLFLLLLPVFSCADVAPNKKHEIAHLLVYIERSSCELKLNGSLYQGMDAVIFIQKNINFSGTISGVPRTL